jgi:hypothetical protein
VAARAAPAARAARAAPAIPVDLPEPATDIMPVIRADGPPPGGAGEATGMKPASGGNVAGDNVAGDNLDPRLTTDELGHFGLPVRVRQASLAPQLRRAPRPESGSPESGSPGGDHRQVSAETARSTMAALQRGWERGRQSDTGSPPPDAGAGSDPAVGASGHDNSGHDNSGRDDNEQ